MHEPGRKPVVDLALSRGATAVADAASRSKILGRLRFGDAAFRNLTRGAAILVLGIPSIIYGIWGLFVFAPFLQRFVQPFLIDAFEHVPVLSTLFEGPPYGIGTLTAGLILAIMVLPFITSISRDVFEAVPPVLKEAAYGVGCTTWEVVRTWCCPTHGSASSAASCLAS